jgi:hypothetical protein
MDVCPKPDMNNRPVMSENKIERLIDLFISCIFNKKFLKGAKLGQMSMFHAASNQESLFLRNHSYFFIRKSRQWRD